MEKSRAPGVAEPGSPGLETVRPRPFRIHHDPSVIGQRATARQSVVAMVPRMVPLESNGTLGESCRFAESQASRRGRLDPPQSEKDFHGKFGGLSKFHAPSHPTKLVGKLLRRLRLFSSAG